MPTLLSLEAITPQDRPRVGGKAHHLARLVQRGLPVPGGFVITTDALHEVMEAAGLLERAERMARLPTLEDARFLHDALLEIPVPPRLEAAIRAAARRLGSRLAVRSSGTDEDGRTRSFAGAHESLLDVPGDELVGAVRRCWASLYATPAIAYRERSGHGPPAAGMAVLVQRLVDSAVSGVMFTVNPLSGSWREMTIEATWGLCEGVASGRVAPHWYLVRRPRRAPRPVQRVLSRVRLQLVQRDLPDIPEQFVPTGAGVEAQPVPSEWQGRPTLERSDLFRLCRLGLRVEGLLGAPQDVEWTIDHAGQLYLLQARPITTAGAPRARTDEIWTRRFVGERWPEPATPLGWSIMEPVLEHFIAYPRTQSRYLGGGPAIRLVRSRPYLNVTVFRHLAFKLPGAPAPRFMTEFFPPEEEAEWHRRFAELPDLSVYASIFRETFQERRWRRFRWNPLTNHLAWDRFRERLEVELPPLTRDPMGAADAIRLVEAQLQLIYDYVKVHVTSLLFANLSYQLLEGALAVYLPERAPSLMERLATCPPGNLTLATNEALWNLARCGTPAEIDALERGVTPDPTSPFGVALKDFLATYGHRSAASWEVFTPRWADRPELLVPLLRSQRSGDAEEPALRAERQQDEFLEAEREVRSLLPPPRLALVEALVHYTRRYLLLRENQRFWFDRLLHAMHRTLHWIGADLVARGWLEDADDIAFLTFTEVKGLAEGTLAPEPVPEWVARRRAKRDADAEHAPPVFLRGDASPELQPTGARMQGLGISPGRARGRVRVVRTIAEGHRLEPGEVLVAHAVDPGWTPLFLHASAVVLEMGSRLSHGAVVAREYRVPAVVNIDGATRRLRDGQEVTVDGTRGVVFVHP